MSKCYAVLEVESQHVLGVYKEVTKAIEAIKAVLSSLDGDTFDDEKLTATFTHKGVGVSYKGEHCGFYIFIADYIK